MPEFTQPVMYEQIARHEGVAAMFGRRLIENGDLTARGLKSIRTRVAAEVDRVEPDANRSREPGQP